MDERETSIYILDEILNNKAYNNIILKKTLDKNNLFNNIQKSFITEIVNGTLRNLIFIDFVINQFSNTKTSKMKPFILNILRISVYQIMFMNKVPISAACNEAVKLAKKRGFINLSGFVNGILRNISRNINNINFPDESKNKVDFLSVKYSFPKWIIEYWLEFLSYKDVKKICENSVKSPKINICINTVITDYKEIINKFENNNIEIDKGILENSFYINKINDITKNNEFKKGYFHVMNESSMLSVNILNPKENSIVIDICAAPGGKSFYCAYLMNNKGKIISRDIYEHKIDLIKDSAKRLKLDIIDAQLKDAAKFYKEDENIADYIIADVPCSGFGLLRKKPDIKYTKSIDDIKNLVSLQREILKNCWKYVKTGGTLVYSTCTISKMENLDNVNWFCENYPFELVDISDFIPKDLECSTAKDGYIQILPDTAQTDGFFIAKMIRKG